MLKLLTTLLLFGISLGDGWLDEQIATEMDTVTCNNIFPFTFQTTSGGLQIIDWDIQNFNDNYSRYQASKNSYAVTQQSFVAMVFRDSGGLYCGVTYETERTFKWARQINDVKSTGLAAVKIASIQQETNPSTSVISQPNNDARVYLAYEADYIDDSIIHFVSFNYLTGVLEKAYKIHKGTNALANQMILQNVMGAGSMTFGATYNQELSVMKLVMSFSFPSEAIEFQFNINSNQNPLPFRMFSYQANSGSGSNFENTDYSKLLGISAKSKQYYNCNGGCVASQFQQDMIANFTSGSSITDPTLGYYNLMRNNPLYLFRWTSATAFLTTISWTPVGQTISSVNNTVWWYATKYHGTTHRIQEYSYTFTTSQALTSYSVSPDAPQLCMTQPGELYIDDIQRGLIYQENQLKVVPQWWPGPNPTAHWYDTYSLDTSDQTFELTMGLKQFHISGTTGTNVLCRAINSQVENISMNQGLQVQYTYSSMCLSHTIVLLEEPSAGILHIVQIKFKRNSSWNQAYANSKGWGMPLSCSNIAYASQNTFSNTKTYIQYSIQYDPSTIFSKSFINYGFDMATTPPTPLPENILTNDQQQSFYFAGIGSDGQISLDTNNLKLRCKPVVSSPALDLTIDDTLPIQNKSWISVQNWVGPVFQQVRFVKPSSTTNPFTSLNQVFSSSTPTLSPAQYWLQSSSATIINLKTSLLIIDWSVCTLPITFGIDPQVENGLLCLQVNENSVLHNMQKQGKNLKFSSGSVSDSQFNIWPYSNCYDRSTNPYFPSTSTLKSPNSTFSYYFSGLIANSQVVPQFNRSENITFFYNQGGDYMQIKFQPLQQGTLGLHQSLNFTFIIGVDSINTTYTWLQQTMLLNSCQPKDFKWQTKQDVRKFPILDQYFYGQGAYNILLPSPIVTNPNISYKIDQSNYLAFSYQLLIQNKTGTFILNSTEFYIQNGLIILNSDQGDDVNLTFGAIATSINPYYYVEAGTGEIKQDFISMNITQIATIQFVMNIAPKFLTKPPDIKINKTQDLIYNLPDIYDPDSDQAYIQKILLIPSSNFARLVNTKQKTGSYLQISPTNSTKPGSYICLVYLIDVSPSARITPEVINIIVAADQVQLTQETFVFKNNTKSVVDFKTDKSVGISIQQVYQNQSVLLHFNVPMELYINPLYVESENQRVNVTNVLAQYLNLNHKQYISYTKQYIKLKDPTFQIIYYNGIALMIQIVYPNQNLLSKSQTQAKDYVCFNFNDSQIFLSQNQKISESKLWQLESLMPIMLDSSSAAVKSVASAASSSITSFMTTNFVLNLLMVTSLQKMWGQLNILMLILHTPLLQVNLPQSVQILCGAMISIVQFDIIDSDAITNRVFGIGNFNSNTTNPYNDKFNNLGYQNLNFILNFASLFYYWAFFVSLYIIALFISILNSFFVSQKIKRILKIVRKLLPLSLFIRLFIESNFELAIDGYLQLLCFDKLTSGLDIFSLSLGVLAGISCLFVPIVCGILISRFHYQKILHEKKVIEKYGELYAQQLWNRPELVQVLYNILFMFRRLATFCCIFFMNRIPSFQIGVMIWMTEFWLGYSIGTKPYTDPQVNFLEKVNEFSYWFVLFLSFSFTEFMPNNYAQSYTGIIWCSIIGFMMLVNICFQLADTGSQLILRMKKCKLRYDQKQKKWSRWRPLIGQRRAFLSHSTVLDEILRKQYYNRVKIDILNDIKFTITETFQDKPETSQHQSNLLETQKNLQNKQLKRRNQKNLTLDEPEKESNQQNMNLSQLFDNQLQEENLMNKTTKLKNSVAINENAYLQDQSENTNKLIKLKRREMKQLQIEKLQALPMPAVGEQIELPYFSELSDMELPPVQNIPKHPQKNCDLDFSLRNYD